MYDHGFNVDKYDRLLGRWEPLTGEDGAPEESRTFSDVSIGTSLGVSPGNRTRLYMVSSTNKNAKIMRAMLKAKTT
jgi:hypothetical protein